MADYSIIEEIKEKIDIVELINSYFPLTKVGVNYKALCPFHKEKTPSFFVSPERQIWHCFGCGEGGDIFKFVMKYENLDFSEALRLLAKKAGIELKKEDPRLRNEMLKLYEICEKAADFFEKQLEKNPLVQKYLANRGLKQETLKFWQIGYAPDGTAELFRYLLNHNFKTEDILKSGLIIKSNFQPNAFYDRFRSRIIFPLFDHQDRIVGFTGRIFNEEKYPNEPKYLNSPETPIFNKGKILYGFSKNKEAIRKENYAVLVEGQIDLLMAWQDGVKNVLATSGTALTEEHLKAIKKLTRNIILAYDMDEAGRLATERAIDLAKTQEFNVFVLSLAGVKDIADFVLAKPAKLIEELQKAEEAINYYYRYCRENFDFTNLEEKKKAIDFFLSKIQYLENPIERAEWLKKIAEESQIKENYLEEELMRLREQKKNPLPSEEKKEISLPPVKSRKELLTERILALAFKKEDLRLKLMEIKNWLSSDYYLLVESIANNNYRLENAAVEEKLAYLNLLADYEFETLTEEVDLFSEFEKTLGELKKEILREIISEKINLIKTAEEQNDWEKIDQTLKEFHQILKEFSV